MKHHLYRGDKRCDKPHLLQLKFLNDVTSPVRALSTMSLSTGGTILTKILPCGATRRGWTRSQYFLVVAISRVRQKSWRVHRLLSMDIVDRSLVFIFHRTPRSDPLHGHLNSFIPIECLGIDPPPLRRNGRSHGNVSKNRSCHPIIRGGRM